MTSTPSGFIPKDAIRRVKMREGTVFFVRTGLDPVMRYSASFEFLELNFKHKNHNILIIIVYKPPNLASFLKLFFWEIELFVVKFASQFDLLIIGDFDI